ncbi:FUSC family protein [Acinetobacter qingfengensis]|uniref:Fusaric acid resistance protein n=1 Tax=Acinetobacter qingfengensis TaxID=1262585 RepID=A0A1E7RFS4_9GAMM|nr:FUSC family protein [Acinetobacter qingfengensis]KAA8732738.1 FUSC family protein [Acinetobacter qingfengensis]OEY98146.1 fusaric acid resistance protein [Acinetobacter qingfengensis]
MLLTKQLLAFRPDRTDLIFASKTFFAGMVALYIAFRLDLPYPMWAIGTVFILANPYSGMVSSKALYRLMGTFFGAAMALLMLPHLINTPWLFTLIIAAWVAFCLYISLLDRTPRSYMFMLAGYTCVMVVTNAINNMSSTTSTYTMFDIALGRVLEISVAVIVTSVVFSSIFPLHIGTAIQKRLQKAFDETQSVFIRLFNEKQSSRSAADLISAINRDTNDIHGLAVHLSYEKGHLKGMTKPLQELLHQFSLVFVNLIAMSQRLTQLDELEPQIRQQLQPIIQNILVFLKQKPDITIPSIQVLPENFHEDFQILIEQTHSRHAQIVLESLKMDIRHFIQNIYTVKFIWELIQKGERKLPDFITPLTTHYPSLHRDHGVAVRGGLAAFFSVAIAFAIWIYSGWQYGYMMAQMAAVVACILTALDNPIPTLKVFMRGTLYATLIVFVYLFFILPDVKEFWQLAIVLAPVMIYSVCLIPHPPLTGLGLPISINVIMALNLQNHYQISPIPSIDAAIAGLIGPIIPVLALYYIRAMSPDITAQRLLSAHYRAMYETLDLPFGSQLKIHVRGMLDRLGLLSNKMVQDQQVKIQINEALIETSAAIDLTRLQELAQHQDIPFALHEEIQHLRQKLFQAFQQLEKNPIHHHVDTQAIFQSLDRIRDLSFLLQNQDIQHRLWMSINNVRYSICHASMQAHLQIQATPHRENTV